MINNHCSVEKKYARPAFIIGNLYAHMLLSVTHKRVRANLYKLN